MKQFLKKIIFFLLLLGIANSIIYIFLTKEIVYNKYALNEKGFKDYDVFILSDSHGEALKNLTNKFGIFNFSYVGDNYQDMYYKLSYLSPHLDENDVVLITVNNHTLSTYRDASSNTKRNLAYVNSKENVFDDKLNIEFMKSKIFKRTPLFQVTYGKFYFDYLKSRLKNDSFDDIDFENIPIDIKKQLVFERFDQQFVGHRVSEKELFFLKEIIKMSKVNKFQLKGIKYPVTELYQSAIKDSNMNAQEVLLLNNIETIDFQEALSLTDNFFRDQDHLNKKGAQVLLEVLKEILNKK